MNINVIQKLLADSYSHRVVIVFAGVKWIFCQLAMPRPYLYIEDAKWKRNQREWKKNTITKQPWTTVCIV